MPVPHDNTTRRTPFRDGTYRPTCACGWKSPLTDLPTSLHAADDMYIRHIPAPKVEPVVWPPATYPVRGRIRVVSGGLPGLGRRH